MALVNKYEGQVKNGKSCKSNKKKRLQMMSSIEVFTKSNVEDNLDPPSKKKRKLTKKHHNALDLRESEGTNFIYSCVGSKNKLLKNEISEVCVNAQTAASIITENKKQKKKKKMTLKQKVKMDSNNSGHKGNTIKLEENEQNLHKKVQHKNKLGIKYIDETRGIEFNVKDKETKKKVQKLLSEKYKPGMLSELLQIRNYGRLIVPWDPSFGLDPSYKIPSNIGEDEPKLTINPLFDLSKRNDAYLSSANSTKNVVFVGNLPSDIEIFQLKKLFRKCGLIHSIKLRQNKSKKNKHKLENQNNSSETNNITPAHALLRFLSVESSEAALKLNGLLYKGHHLRVAMSKDEEKPQPERSVFIGNIAFEAQDDDLWKIFGDCGAIESVRIVRTQSGKAKGIGFVNFKTDKSVEHALKLDGTMLLDRNIRVTRNKTNARSLSDTIIVKKRRKKRSFLSLTKRIRGNFIENKLLLEAKLRQNN